jgi:hypothetical protein
MPYLDDVITRHRVTDNAEATENALSDWFRDFVDRCVKYHTTVNAKKTKLFCTESTILGHTVAHRTITPLQHRLDALRHYETLHDRASLVRFLALVRYYSSHIPMLSALTGPLNHLTTPGKHFKWTEIENAAFEATKAALLNTAALSEPRYDRPFYLTTDASDKAVGWVLEQYDDDSAPRIVAMGGCRHRSPAEERYSIFELETLALKRALEHLQPLLDSNNHTTIWRTDSQTAASFKRCELDGKSSAMRAFVISMQHVDLDIELISGTDNPVADAVSRFNNFYRSQPINICVIDDATTPVGSRPTSPQHTPSLDRPIPTVSLEVPRGEPSLPAAASTPRPPDQANPEEEEMEETVVMQSTPPPLPSTTTPSTTTTSTTSTTTTTTPAASSSATVDPLSEQVRRNITTLIEAQRADASLAPYWRAAEGADAPAGIKSMRPCLDDNGILRVRLLTNSGVTVIAVPESKRTEFVQMVHRSPDNGHAAVAATKFALAQFAWWPSMAADVDKQVKDCLACQIFRAVPLDSKQGTPQAKLARFERIHMDHAPLPPANNGANGVYVLTDAATGWSMLFEAHDKTAASAVKAVRRLIATLGSVPRVVQTDSGTELTSQEMKQFAIDNNFTLEPGSPYNQRSNGVAESVSSS